MAVASETHKARSGRSWSYVPELDGLRALAIAAVVLFHYVTDLVPGGYLGVTVFFVLSGYLITGLLITEQTNNGRVDLRAFYTRRLLRLYPALLVVVIGTLALSTITGHEGITTPRIYGAGLFSLLYVNDLAAATGHLSVWLDWSWSLSVEEQFYLVWPLILFAAVRRFPVATVARGCLAIGLLLAALDPALGHVVGANRVYYTVGNAVPLLAGCVIALIRPRVRWLIAAGSGVCLVVLFLVALPGAAGAFRGPEQLAALAAAGVVAFLAGHGEVPVLKSRTMVWLGRRSYGIYLIHVPIRAGLSNGLPHLTSAELASIGIPLSIVLAALSYRFVEQPFLRRKHRYERVGAGPGRSPARVR